MLLAGGVFAAGQTIELNFMSQMKTRTMLLTKIITSQLGVIFNFAGAYLFGIAGIVFANVLFCSLFTICMAILSVKTMSDYNI
jgi:hypothetical protein